MAILLYCSSLSIWASNSVIVAVFAHPDDETWISGTLSAIAAEDKATIYIVYATSGGAGRNYLSDRTNDSLESIRKDEASLAIKSLGITTAPVFLNMTDASLTEEIPILQDKLSTLFKKLKATHIITFGRDGVTGHPDHYAASVAATHAFYAYKKANALFYIAMSKTRSEILNTITETRQVPFKLKNAIDDKLIHLKINTAKFKNNRINAMKAHQSQFPPALIGAFEEFVNHAPCEELIISSPEKENKLFNILPMSTYNCPL